MTREDDYKATAAKCTELAEKAVSPADRQRWLSMAQFWLQRCKAYSVGEDDDDDLVTVQN
jgi:hypothetical protein